MQGIKYVCHRVSVFLNMFYKLFHSILHARSSVSLVNVMAPNNHPADNLKQLKNLSTNVSFHQLQSVAEAIKSKYRQPLDYNDADTMPITI